MRQTKKEARINFRVTAKAQIIVHNEMHTTALPKKKKKKKSSGTGKASELARMK